MSRPSEKALDLAEELLDYAHPGMNRSAAIEEIATMIDEMNAELLEVVAALVNDSEKRSVNQHAALLDHLRQIAASYRPWAAKSEGQHELFTSETQTTTTPAPIAGQMP